MATGEEVQDANGAEISVGSRVVVPAVVYEKGKPPRQTEDFGVVTKITDLDVNYEGNGYEYPKVYVQFDEDWSEPFNTWPVGYDAPVFQCADVKVVK